MTGSTPRGSRRSPAATTSHTNRCQTHTHTHERDRRRRCSTQESTAKLHAGRGDGEQRRTHLGPRLWALHLAVEVAEANTRGEELRAHARAQHTHIYNGVTERRTPPMRAHAGQWTRTSSLSPFKITTCTLGLSSSCATHNALHTQHQHEGAHEQARSQRGAPAPARP